MREIRWERDALRTLVRLDKRERLRIVAKVEQYAANPGSLSNQVKRLRGRREIYRMRVGDRRILFSLSADTVVVWDVPPRGSAYD